MASKEKRTQRRVMYVAEDDIAVHEWMNGQRNMSQSLRMLVVRAIADYGYTDIFDAMMADKMTQPQAPVQAPVVEPMVIPATPVPVVQAAVPPVTPVAPEVVEEVVTPVTPKQAAPRHEDPPMERPGKLGGDDWRAMAKGRL